MLAILHVSRDERLGRDGHWLGQEAHEPPYLQRHLVCGQCRLTAQGGCASEHRIREHEAYRSREEHRGHVHEGFDDLFSWQAPPYQGHVSQWLRRCLHAPVHPHGRYHIVHRRADLGCDRGRGSTSGPPSLEQRQPNISHQIDDAGRAEYSQGSPRISSAKGGSLQDRGQKHERQASCPYQQIRTGGIQQRRVGGGDARQLQQRIREFAQTKGHERSEQDRETRRVGHDALVEVDPPGCLARIVGIVDALGRIGCDQVGGRGREEEEGEEGKLKYGGARRHGGQRSGRNLADASRVDERHDRIE
mmetsp:Transcript_24786/g.59787  ORF Transcript_24786/g.59787 Transcript_24786/m.59787 type:complete len:304 (+) Transcript_24786:900-1811(+)